MSLTEVNLGQGMTGQQMVPVAGESEWVALCLDPKTVDLQYLLKPTLVSRAAQRVALVNRSGTTIQVCLRYHAVEAVSTPPVVRLIGISRAGIPQLLADEEGDTSLTMTAAATDLVDADGNAYTAAQEVDGKNNAKIMALIETALAGGGTVGHATNGPQIMIKAL